MRLRGRATSTSFASANAGIVSPPAEGAAPELTHTKSGAGALSLSSLSNAALSRANSKSSGNGNGKGKGKKDGFEESGLSAAQRAIKALPLEDEQASTGSSKSSLDKDDRSPRTREKERLDKKTSWTPFKGFRKAPDSGKKVDPKDPSTWGAKKL